MDEDVRQFGEQLGKRALARDWAAVHALLAPWLRSVISAADVQAFFENEYRETLKAGNIDGMHYPEYPEPELGGNNFMSATELRKPISFAGNKVRPVAAEVTDANVRYWLSLKLTCSDAQMETLGFDFFSETWISVVNTDEGLRVGYWSQGAY